MKILALEAYYGGSHKSFLDGWINNSQHDWTLLTLAANKWKWRMRHSAVTFANEVREHINQGKSWDILFCTDMLNLAEFLGLAGLQSGQISTVIYFHENQLTYPVRFESERDYQFAMTNLTSALAAKQVWFNSAFHKDEFWAALRVFLKRMPDNQPMEAIEDIQAKSKVYPPGIPALAKRGERAKGPARILWAARWEHDKNPEDFFEALKRLKENGIDFRLSVLGEQFREVPEVFSWARDFFKEQIERWGYQENRCDYESGLAEADIIVSTADHEFFGISVVEAIAAGAYPLLPKRLSYPEIISNIDTDTPEEYFYDGTVDNLIERLIGLIQSADNGILWQDRLSGIEGMKKFHWDNLAKTMDDALGNMFD